MCTWGEPDTVARAPGRVNLIGEHTDYNDGFTLPMALPFDTAVALSSTGDDRTGPVIVESAGFGEVVIDPAVPREVPAWAAHIGGVVELLADAGVPSAGWRGRLETDIPTGASLSSSAALEVVLTIALLARADLEWSAIDVARLGQRVENEVVGLQSGIMDQFISAGAVTGHASLMDCRALTLTPTSVPTDVVVAIMDTKTRRVLADAAYDDRRLACERAAADIGVDALRDATLDDLDRVRDPLDRRRALHVISENRRTLDGAEALTAGDAIAFGRLMNESHASLRDDFEVSGPGLDSIVEAARASTGCVGARLTGGGFAGCAVALVRADDADRFTAELIDRYHFDGNTAEVWICEPAPGASVAS